MESKNSYQLTIDHTLDKFKTHISKGLSAEEAGIRIEKHGYNELMEKKRPGFLKLLWDQFKDFLVRILIAAALISFFLGEIVDGIAIISIVILNAILGVIQESKAEKALAALKKMAAPNARVIRDGSEVTIPARELVPGDIVIIETGNYIPADMRLIESINLKIEEASLTGESVPVNKDAHTVLDKEIPIGDRKNSAFMSTIVTYGRGKGLVTSTGMNTEIGLIAEMLQSYEEEETPLQKKLNQLGKLLGIISLIICGIIFVYGVIRDTNTGAIITEGIVNYFKNEQKNLLDLFMTAVSLAIAAVPEGLPAVVTICLALGMQRMIKKHSLIRKLPAVETLGSATVICSDKTGTLTQNQMMVVKAWAGGKTINITGEGYNPSGTFEMNNKSFDPSKDLTFNLLLHGSLLCNDAKLEKSGFNDNKVTYRMIGDPTEGALVVAAAKSKINIDNISNKYPRVNEIPFDSDRKRMATIHEVKSRTFEKIKNISSNKYLVMVKGAPDIILKYCTHMLEEGNVVVLNDKKVKEILEINHEMASKALRVLALAYKGTNKIPENLNPENTEVDLTFIGLMGMMDPARPEVKTAVNTARGAGLKSVMVTGDYKDTAEAIAKEIGILRKDGKILTGTELDDMTEEELAKIVDDVDVYARVSPSHKTKIIDALKNKGHIVAMTGDGVNDAPALKRANIGIAMGITGTDVSKETADMVLTDDNYASIVSAIEEGRIIYSNIRKFVFYLISCNIGEILIIFISMLMGLPIPLRPIQLLWLNLVTDGAPALALGMEKGDPDIMKRSPRPVREAVINKEMLLGVIVQALVMTSAVLASFIYGLKRYPNDLADAQTIAFTTLIMSELLRAYTSRSERFSLFKIGIFGNKWMQYAVISSFLLLIAVIYMPFLQPFFNTIPLTVYDWLFITPLFLASSIAAELTKAFIRLKEKMKKRSM